MEERHILLTPNKEHRQVFPNMPVVGFRMAMALKTTWLGANYQDLKKVKDINHVRKNLLFL